MVLLLTLSVAIFTYKLLTSNTDLHIPWKNIWEKYLFKDKTLFFPLAIILALMKKQAGVYHASSFLTQKYTPASFLNSTKMIAKGKMFDL